MRIIETVPWGLFLLSTLNALAYSIDDGSTTRIILSVIAMIISMFAGWFAVVGDIDVLQQNRALPAVVSVEFITRLWIDDTSVLMTIAIATSLIFWELDIINPAVSLIWIIVHVGIGVLGTDMDDTETLRWRTAQYLLATATALHITTKFIIEPAKKNNFIGKAAASIVYGIGSRVRTLALPTILIAVIGLYDGEHVIPWGGSTLMLVIPIVYLLSATIPGEEARRNMYKPETPYWAGLVTGLIVLAITIWGFTYDRAPTYTPGEQVCEPYTNQVPCINAPGEIIIDADRGCCCPRDMVKMTDQPRCYPEMCIKMEIEGLDCCSKRRHVPTDIYMAGKYQCICGNTPEDPDKNKLSINKCECAEGFGGDRCLHQLIITPNVTNSSI